MDKGTLCRIRDLSRAIEEYSQTFEAADMGPGELAHSLGLKGPHASKLIAQLEAQKLVKRKLCKEDKRCMRFSLTEAGLQRLAELEAASLPLPDVLR